LYLPNIQKKLLALKFTKVFFIYISLYRLPGLEIEDDFSSLISLMSSPAPDSRITTMISQSHDYSPCKVLGNKNATQICDFGYFPDSDNAMCYGLIQISPDQNIIIGNARQYCTGNANLLNLNSKEDIHNLEELLQKGKIFLESVF
jgi:hypothetical protein